jgi:hypothetical protein
MSVYEFRNMHFQKICFRSKEAGVLLVSKMDYEGREPLSAELKRSQKKRILVA